MIENNRVFAGDPKNAAVEDLTPYTSKSKVIPNVVAGRLAWTTVGGHTYGLPHDVHPVIMIYNDTIWSKAGVNVAKIATWDQFFKDAAKLVKFEEKGRQTHSFCSSFRQRRSRRHNVDDLAADWRSDLRQKRQSYPHFKDFLLS